MSRFKQIIQEAGEAVSEIREFLGMPILKLGSTSISLGSIFYFVIAITFLLFIANGIKRLLVNRILPRYTADIGSRQAIGTISRYIVLLIGIIIIIQNAGVDLTALGFVAGALTVGIGFGLQNITNNFISGIIILFERPIKVGDRIEVGNINGDVIKISARSTTINTNDNISVIVPNSEFISNRVTNWSYNTRMVRFKYDVGVSYKEEPEKIRKLLLSVAAENEGILNEPAADVLFSAFGDSSLNFTLQVWTIDYIDRPNLLKSQLYYAIFKVFKDNNIEIPFPQRDLHLKSGFEKIAKN